MKINCLIILFLIAFGACSSNESGEAEKVNQLTDTLDTKKSFISFWKNFRVSILDSNYDDTKQFVQFPLKIQGYQDTDPELKINKNSFTSVFNEFLMDDYTANYKDSMLTHYHFIRSVNDIETYDQSSFDNDNFVRIENMEFEYHNGSWKMVLIYHGTQNNESTKDAIIEKGTVKGTFIEIEWGDYPHLNMKTENGEVRSFFILEYPDKDLFLKLSEDESYKGKKIKVDWVKANTYLEAAGGKNVIEKVVKIEFVK